MTLKDSKSQVIVEVNHLSFQYPETLSPSLVDVSFSLSVHDCVLVLGANGSGKSTLLSLIGGVRKPLGGQGVRVLGQDPFDCTSMHSQISLMGEPWPPEAVFGNSVDTLTSPAPYPERRKRLADSLHLRLSRAVDSMSSGEKRRVQLLHALLPESKVFLLDECSTDIDVIERKTVLELVKKEVLERNGCCLYATHVFDAVDLWATHVALMANGRLVDFLPIATMLERCKSESVKAIWGYTKLKAGGRGMVSCTSALEEFAYQFMTSPNSVLSETFEKNNPVEISEDYSGKQYQHCDEEQSFAIECTELSYKNIFNRMTFKISRGTRTLLCGCNGSGKSTLLNMIGGVQFFNNADHALKVMGWACYEEMKRVNESVSYGGNWWPRRPEGEMYIHQLLPPQSTSRIRHLCNLLGVKVDRDIRKLSTGECKRVQLVLQMAEDKPVILLDEATADLDVDQRFRLLHFLYQESVQRGVTIIYATHIFNGLEGWASHIMILDRTKQGLCGIWPTCAEENHISKSAADEESCMKLSEIPLYLARLKKAEKF